MLAENYRYLDEVELLKRLHDDGRFGEDYFGKGNTSTTARIRGTTREVVRPGADKGSTMSTARTASARCSKSSMIAWKW